MTQRTLLLTGAAGGMGRACARLLGADHDLILTDVSASALAAFADELTQEGYRVREARAGDLGDDALLQALVADLGGAAPFTLLHTAGLSPAMADWRRIMEVNLQATVRLIDAVEPVLRPGSVGILIASTAGHMMPPIPEVQPLFDQPLAPDFLDRLEPVIEAMAAGGVAAGAEGLSYSFSKQAVIRLVEQRARKWGQSGARIASISPGVILTPMGRKELAETRGAAETRDAAPVGRAGRAMDIALAAQFLASEAASFITGCDLRVDGGSVAATRFG